MKVAVIGRAWRTALADTIDGAIARLVARDHGVIEDERGRVAPIPHEPAPSRHARFLRRIALFGMEVATEAAVGMPRGDRAGLYTGVGGMRASWDEMMPALAEQRDDGADAWARGLGALHPYWMLRHLSNGMHALASAELGLCGDGATFGGANAGAHALAAATRALHAGAIDVALVVAYDTLLEPETLVELRLRGGDDVPGEAAAALALARPEHGAAVIDPKDLAGSTVAAAMGKLGAATALVEAIARTRLHAGASELGL